MVMAMGDLMNFDYDKAFSRNIGWITEEEQKTIQSKTIALAGMGGVGGVHLITLVRMGFKKFHLADFDSFEIHNFNRQAGAFISTIGHKKLDVMIKMAKDINPELEIKAFPEGVNENNLETFLSGADIYLDGLDFFVLKLRELIFTRAYEKNIPSVTVGPIGMGASLVNILPGGMSFEDYFGFSHAKDDNERAVHFALGISPKRIQTKYLAAPEKLDFKNKKVSSTPMGCQMCSAVAGTEILKILLKRGKVYGAPYSVQYDAYLNKAVRSWIPFGYRNPLQRLRIFIGKKFFVNKKR